MTDGSSMGEDETDADEGTSGEGGGQSGKGHVLKRRTYVAMRLPDVGEEIKTLAAERGRLSAEIKDRGEEKSEEVRKMRERRMYVAARLNMLRTEQQDLNRERKEAQATAKSSGKSPGKGGGKGTRKAPAKAGAKT